MDNRKEEHIVTLGQAVILIFSAIGMIVVGLKVFKAPIAILLLSTGVLSTLIATLFGVQYTKIQAEMLKTIQSMIMAILILLLVGILVGTWIASGTVPAMIYYGMKLITPTYFLPIVCLISTGMSVLAGTSWGTLATVGVAFMGMAQGLGIPLEMTAGAVVVGAFFGDKVSPLSDSPVLVSSIVDVPLVEGIRHSLWTTGASWLLSMLLFAFLGQQLSVTEMGSSGLYELIIQTLESNFHLTPWLFLPPLVVVLLVLFNKPTLPTFTAGILVGAVLALVVQQVSVQELVHIMQAGFSRTTGVDLVDEMLQRGGLQSMLGTVGMLMAAGVFAAPLKAAGLVELLLDQVLRYAQTEDSMTIGVLVLHAAFFLMTGAYYVSYPVVGPMVKGLFEAYGLKNENLMRLLLDSGTGLAPAVPWSTTGAYTAATLGILNSAFLPYAPLLWLPFILNIAISLLGFNTKISEAATKVEEDVSYRSPLRGASEQSLEGGTSYVVSH